MRIIVTLLLAVFTLGASAQKEINVAAFNIRMNTEKDGVNAWPKRAESVRALIKYHDFDIMGTQEGFKSQLEDIAQLKEYAYVGAGRDDGKEGGEHSAIFYKKDRFQILESGDFWLSETPDKPGKGWDATCCNRIASWAKFKDKKSKKTFYFFNVHFDHQGVVARRESGELMVSKIKEIAKGAPAILTGDFNSKPETEQIKTLAAFMPDSYVVSQTPPYGPVGTFTGFKADAAMKDRIDYVFISRSMKVLKYGVLTDHKNLLYPSDHFPVVVKVKL